MNQGEPMSYSSVFKTPQDESAYRNAYDAAMQSWPVAYEEIETPSRFGMTHVVVSGPKDAPPFVLLHGYMATLVMWLPNIADLSKEYRVYAIDVMGQPGKSIPGEPIRNRTDFVEWLTATLNGLHLKRVSLAGVSFGGWLTLAYTVAAPERVQKLVLLSPGGLLPIARKFRLRGMLMMLFPTRFTVKSFMRWVGFRESPSDANGRHILDVMYLGMKHFRMPKTTARIAANALFDDELRAIHAPVLLLMGNQEVLYDASAALDRARRLIPNLQGELIPGCSHDMAFSQHQIVDARVLEFLGQTSAKESRLHSTAARRLALLPPIR
jgi:pimeloyl-ACP methyl ester carboxylesterase